MLGRRRDGRPPVVALPPAYLHPQPSRGAMGRMSDNNTWFITGNGS
jgi:hypothetical protein